MNPIMIESWPRAIMHVDCDAFFASVEQAVNPELKGKPVITGAERGIVAAASYEAKALGVRRGMRLSEVAAISKDIIMLPSDYETYSIFSKRLFGILRRFTPVVEEYSIDEAFCDLTGMRRVYRCSYPDIGRKVQEAVKRELDITVSVGISLSKSLAKLASKYRKPVGLTAVRGREIHTFLKNTELEKVWGFGPNTVALLQKHGLKTALDFANKPLAFAQKLLGKVGAEVWMELRGQYAYRLNPEEKKSYASISKAKTFTPASSDPDYVYAQALRNLESALIKARRYKLVPSKISLSLRQDDFSTQGLEMKLSRSSSSVIDVAPSLKMLFRELFRIGPKYRQTCVVLAGLENHASEDQFGLFEDPVKVINAKRLSTAVDDINGRFGKHTVFMAPGLYLSRYFNSRRRSVLRNQRVIKGETVRQHLRLPLLNYILANR